MDESSLICIDSCYSVFLTAMVQIFLLSFDVLSFVICANEFALFGASMGGIQFLEAGFAELL